jgi:phosphohistidine swiveling domain-containing protein
VIYLEKYNITFLNKKDCIGEVIFFNLNKNMTNKIIVLDNATPVMAPELVNAKGFIVETGGILSHFAIFARELNVCCIKLENAANILSDSMKIHIDSQNNKLEVLGT